MEEKAIRGVPWTLLSYAANRVVVLLTTIVLARLLVPEDFGLLALGLMAVTLLNVLSDLGLSATLVLRRDLDLRAQGTVLTMMLAASLALAVLVAAASPLLADFFDEPRLDEVLAVLAIGILVAGVTWFYDSILQRELEFRRRFYCLVAQSVALAAVSITLAALGAGVWSLVAGQIAGLVALAATQVALAPYRVRPVFDRAAARSVLGTSWGFLGQSGLAFVAGNADYVAIGRVLGANQVGYYTMGFRIGELPYLGIAEPIARVTFSGFARMRHRGEAVTSPYLTSLALVALVACPLGVLVSATADPFTRAVFGDKWLPMIGPLAVLGLWGAVRPVQGTVSYLLNSVGEAGAMARVAAALIVPLIPALFIAADLGGITAVAWVMLADVMASLVILVALAHRRADVRFAEQWGAVAPVVLGCAIAWGAARGLAEAIADGPAGVVLAASALAGAVAYTAVILVLAPGLPREALRQVRRSMSRDDVEEAG